MIRIVSHRILLPIHSKHVRHHEAHKKELLIMIVKTEKKNVYYPVPECG